MLARAVRVNTIPFRRFLQTCGAWQKVIMKDELMPPSRSDPVIKQLDDPLFHSIFTPELNELAELFKTHNYQLKIAGGAVRDILMNIKPADLDFATDATPDEMKAMFEKENVRMINNKGEKHGTITPRIQNKENFEITTLRIDTHTNGRHAQVEFTKDWKLDALRRDLTINSMFLDLEGRVYDYFFGYEDLQKRRVAFVGSATCRIKEDYLRILRYFRFYGRIAERPDAHDEETIAAIKENMHGLSTISGERIWSEWSKILSGNFAKDLTLKMLECGIARYVGFTEKPNMENFEALCASKDESVALQPISLLAVMLNDEDEVFRLHGRLKLSAFERDLALFLVRYWEDRPSMDALKFYKGLLIHCKWNATNMRRYICELLNCKQRYDLAKEMENMKIPRFPISGIELRKHVKTEKMIGVIVRKLKDIWLDKNFEISTEQLLEHVPRIVGDLENDLETDGKVPVTNLNEHLLVERRK